MLHFLKTKPLLAGQKNILEKQYNAEEKRYENGKK
jgi:hypothetical protein